jgi:hypothetical protein
VAKFTEQGKNGLTVNVQWEDLGDYNAFRLGILQGGNTREFNRLLGIATLNAARTFLKPAKAEAPVWAGANSQASAASRARNPKRTGGTLRKGIVARRGKLDRPSALVGISLGGRGRTGAWYRNMVVSGHADRGASSGGRSNVIAPWSAFASPTGPYPVAPARPTGGGGGGRTPGNDFLRRVTDRANLRAAAVDTLNKTILAYLNGKLGRLQTNTRWQRKGR